jgi:hypothetical protein
VEVGEPVAVVLDGLAQLASHAPIRIHVERNRSGVADQTVGPTGDDASPDDARKRVHPKPSEGAREQQADDDKHRHGGVGIT